MATDNLVRREPIPLPATRDEMLANWKRGTLSLNDAVQRAHIALFDPTDPDNMYPDYLRAVYPESSVEGWLVLDDAKAAEMVKAYADHKDRQDLHAVIGRENTAAIIKALRVVWRRAKLDRKYRAGKVGNETDSD